ncbi:phosphoribosylformylglycinamidine synthase [Fusibacillus kribbianus]|uniref:Phosphoribosylformylglycinamidine synthase n=1 Tax=Fusibacillus kribbianus TaxID=3044208 RepID=A0AAP4B961_9FIRM|nr:phosphoribosylformylglycinamidine synthase [Ruminococcus sp. YH-rum2234]MDI9241013.1 phosphoribosylformylglycinamidine synthase [Ruminococcus sp. YH-rum2234]
MSVRRIYVEKKKPFAVQAKELKEEIGSYLGISTVKNVRVLIRYDVENLSEDTYERSRGTIFSEPPVDILYEGDFERKPEDTVFSVEYLPGQFDQRADSAEQCVKLLNENEEPVIRSATTYVIEGILTEAEKEAIKEHCINPVDSREASEEVPETLIAKFDEPADVKIFEGFAEMEEKEFKELYDSLNLAMTFKDFLHIQNYFKNEEKREPSMTEIRVLDTYWSDHCRHTTFQTELKNVTFGEGDYRKPMEATYDRYMADRAEIFKGRDDKFVCLMDLALMAMRKLKKEGKLADQEESDEINACSIVVPVEIDGVTEEWLVNFKNETHNHPTEIEPFGGAATCLGGAIRDPLSGRTYVYQAMRVTGAADPTVPVSQTMKGKLPQKKLVRGAAHGYSSYGNQIGLATGYVKEIYHPNYAAKRMEIGAVMGAAPRRAVIRETSDPGDIIILLGGRTGRDGCGGATGSSKVHTEKSIETCGAEVQKGNAPTERKIQRLFRREEVSRIIKKCNDFGAGGVSVAIGELADGLVIDLDKVPKKYAGLDGTEIAISESQERMAVVVDKKDVDRFLAFANEENLEAIPVAEVTESPRLVMSWRGKTIVDLSRAFLDTNGAHQETDVTVKVPCRAGNPFDKEPVSDVEAKWMETMKDLNVCSQKGLVEMFDSSIGAGSVYMPYGGKYQMTETQSMVAKLPVLKGKTDTVTMMSYGFDPYLSSWSPYHGAIYAVVSSVAKIVAAGGDYGKIRFTFQEYFRRMTEDPERWGEPFSALLGAYDAQLGFGLPSIGGKDSMSGSFNELDVPPTLVSFAVDVASDKTVITPELKEAGNKLVLFTIDRDEFDMPVYGQVMDQYGRIFEDIKAGKIISAYEVERHGVAEAVTKMAFGNRMGVKIEHNVAPEDLFAAGWGNIVAEVPADKVSQLSGRYTVIGEVTDRAAIEYCTMSIALADAQKAWEAPLEKVFPTVSGVEQTEVKNSLYKADSVYVCKNKVAKPTVFIPVFPGTNCEYDSTKAFERAGANVVTRVLKNITAEDIRDSVEIFEKAISQAQIVMFPGGFSAGDEPEGSAKFFATAFRNARITEAVQKLLNERDGLMLGICNGFQALIKLGLVPYGEIRQQKADSPTLTYNTIGRHISKMVYTKVVSNKSPWLRQAELGGVYCTPASHGEGRFVANDEWLAKLFENGQVATQYVNEFGEPTMDEAWNPNGSYQAIEGITSPDGRIYGKMAHIERRDDSVAINIYGEQDLKVFESGVEYFK